jgi:protein gp37
LSCEPLLGPLDLTSWLWEEAGPEWAGINPSPDLGWVITGGESGPQHRPFDPDWARAVRDQCVAAGVPYFHKQNGGRTPKAGGRELDSRTWDQFPPIA